MELDYKELQAIKAADEMLRTHDRRSKGLPIWSVLPAAFLPLVANHDNSRKFVLLATVCAFALILIFGIVQMLKERRYAKQLATLLNVAKRAMASDAINQRKLNELQTLKSGD